MRWILSLIINTIVILAVAGFFGDKFYISGIGAAFLTSIVLSVLNVTVKPILTIITIPVTFLSLGLFLFVINAVTLEIADWIMGDSFEIYGFWTAIVTAAIISLFTSLLNFFLNPQRD